MRLLDFLLVGGLLIFLVLFLVVDLVYYSSVVL